jgi:glycosyltransferase involved in cell wall biosynthesis
MKVLINCSNLVKGGGLQVAHAVINELSAFRHHQFDVLVSRNLEQFIGSMEDRPNVVFHKMPVSPAALITRGKVLKELRHLETTISPDLVFTLFGPAYWRPRSKHLMGFAIAHYLYPGGPFWQKLGAGSKIKHFLRSKYKIYHVKQNADFWMVETRDARDRLAALLGKENKVYCVPNTYNGVFDAPEKWVRRELPPRAPNEVRLVTIAANYLHKNLAIIKEVVPLLKQLRPDRKFTFVLTVDQHAFGDWDNDGDVIFLGRVGVEECPSLYEECDLVFFPSLMETFSAVFPEAMRMKKPILTSDLPFARDICKDAAVYFDPVNPDDIARAIAGLADNKDLQQQLIRKGELQLQEFGRSADRARKYIEIMEKISQ